MISSVFFPGFSATKLRPELPLSKAKKTAFADVRTPIIGPLSGEQSAFFSYCEALHHFIVGKTSDADHADSEHRLIATACHLQSDLSTLHMQKCRPLNTDESQLLSADLQVFLEQDNIRIEFADSQHWLMTLPTKIPVDTSPFFALCGRSLTHEKVAGDPSGLLLRLQSELQMFLHAHPVNQKRLQQGIAPVNALWLWRDVNPTGSFKLPFDGIYGDCFIQGFGQATHCDTASWQDLRQEELGKKALLIGSHCCLYQDDPDQDQRIADLIAAVIEICFNQRKQHVMVFIEQDLYEFVPWYRRWKLW